MCDDIHYTGAQYLRGQVWFVQEDTRITEAKIQGGSRIQAKSRPYLLYIGYEASLQHPTVVQGFPVSTSIRADDGVDILRDDEIYFYNHRGDRARCLVNQLTSIDTKNLSRYMYTVPEAMMEEIDHMVISRFGLTQQFQEIETRLNQLKAQLLSIEKRAGDDFFKYVNAALGVPSVSAKPNDETKTTEATEIEQDEEGKQSGKTGKNHWTEKTGRRFLSDFDVLSREQMMEKYHLTLSSVLSMKYKLHKKFAN